MKRIKVVELFAGVGGFRLGLNAASNSKVKYETVWSSQWEPGAKTQHASEIYIQKFGNKNHSCEDIQEVIQNKFGEIPNHDLLVGGFPCQDYSVARTLNQAKGIYGKKGILWWSIYNILEKLKNNAPDFLMLENVDRLLKSPSGQRGRDFAVMLASLADLGYIVEWRIVNAADYGFPQRRRRVFIMGYKHGSRPYELLKRGRSIRDWIYKTGVLAKAFPVIKEDRALDEFKIEGDLAFVSKKFSALKPVKSPFENSGVMIDRQVNTVKTIPDYKGDYTLLRDVVIHDEEVIPQEFIINNKDEQKWKYLKGAKKEERESKSGFKYTYSEGPMTFPDSLDKPSRTIVTGEGGSSPSRFKHVIKTKSGKLRRLTPLELERLNMFPDNHTKFMTNNKLTPSSKRAFIMGNALVVGVIEKLGKALLKHI